MEYILFIWVFAIFVISVKNLKWGLYIYLPYIILVPFMNISMFGVSFQWNLVNMFLLLIYFVKYKDHRVKPNFKPLYPFIVFLILTLLMIPFQSGMPMEKAFEYWRLAVFKVLFFPFLIYNVMNQEPSSIKVFRNIMLSCIAIAAIYGLFLTQLEGINPYLMIVMAMNGEEYNLDYALALGEGGRLFGRISSVFPHPMTFGLFLGLSFVYLYRQREHIKPFVFWVLFTIIVLNIVFCGVRSVVGAVGIAVIYYLLVGKKYKLMFLAAFVLFVLPSIMAFIPGLSNYLGSIVDFNQTKTDVGGSNFNMRYDQLMGCFDIIRNNPLLGNGFEWTQYYFAKYGNHPVLLAFESLIFVVLCDFGLFGLALLAIFIRKLVIVPKSFMNKENILLVVCSIIVYIVYSCVTGCGITGYMGIFAIFYVLLLSENIIDKSDSFRVE